MGRFSAFIASWTRRLALAGAVLAVAGCASSLSARVTSFQQWPDGVAGQSYAFAPAGAQPTGTLERQAYQDMVRAAIGATGLVEAQSGTPARFQVDFQYSAEPTQVMSRQPVDPFFYGGGFYGPRWGGWGPWGGYYGPDWVAVPVNAVRNKLTLEIRDMQRGGAEVYRSTASAVTGRDALVEVMPYLVRAVFDDFPGNNGQVREVRYQLD